MKKLLSILTIAIFILHSFPAFGGYVLWFGIEDNAIVKYSNGKVRFLRDFNFDVEVNTIRLARYDSAGNIMMMVPLYYEESPGVWGLDPDVVETDLLSYDSSGTPMGFADWSPASLGEVGSDNKTDRIVMELGFVDFSQIDDNDPSTWDVPFIKLAWSDAISVEALLNAPHAYQTFTLNPPIETPWRPSVFYTYGQEGLPEPGTGSLTLVGIVLLFAKNKRTNAFKQ